MDNTKLSSMYRQMLLDVGEEVNKDESFLEAMKFYCSDIIKTKDRQHIKSALQLWTILEQRDYLREDKTDFLKDLLKQCMRHDVTGLRRVEQYEREVGMTDINNMGQQFYQNHHQAIFPNMVGQNIVYIPVPQMNHDIKPALPTPKTYYGPDLSKEFKILETSFGRHWMFFIRELGLTDAEIEQISMDYHTVRERIHRCLLVWQDREQEKASRDKLIQALRHIQRNDLIEQLTDGNF